MSIRSHITSILGATHLFMLDDATRDVGSSGIATTFTAGTGGSFVAFPVCYGVDNCFRSNTVAGFDNGSLQNGGIIGSTKDINVSPLGYASTRRTINIWFKSSDVSTPTCVYEQGGGNNNFAIIVGSNRVVTFSAADSGQELALTQTLFFAEADRDYMITCIWEHHSQHAGSGNRVLVYANGILQLIHESSATASFPNHSGDNVVANTNDSLKWYNEDTIPFVARSKDVNMLSFHNGRSLTQLEARELYIRTVIGTNIISGTVLQQQAQLDALTGIEFVNVNCPLEIRQATDAMDYTLTFDNLTFTQNEFLKDATPKYIGPNVLTIINENGSNVTDVEVPTEQDLDGSTILTGGGSVSVLNTNQIIFNGVPLGVEFVVKRGSKRIFHIPSTVSATVIFSTTIKDIPVKYIFTGAGIIRTLENELLLTESDQTVPVQFEAPESYI